MNLMEAVRHWRWCVLSCVLQPWTCGTFLAYANMKDAGLVQCIKSARCRKNVDSVSCVFLRFFFALQTQKSKVFLRVFFCSRQLTEPLVGWNSFSSVPEGSFFLAAFLFLLSSGALPSQRKKKTINHPGNGTGV